MSEPKLITPLLADHLMGEPISNHHGVSCYPAIHKVTDEKYIVKIISIPASQVQLDALLLTGAYPSKEAALNYFRELADSAAEEVQHLQKLSNMEGFLAYEGYQIAPMEDRTGFHLYLLGTYKPTLARYLRNKPMTHLGAVNLGLDMCAALSVCRRSGYLYVDLKPENIFLVGDREYRIGDIGFVGLSSLKYASLPDRYRSAYTPPEITDAYSSLNATLDIYAAGLILYQVYNNGELPLPDSDPGQPLPPPAYADYELAEIILKACAPDPADRWQDPAEMGQALVSYMQRNSVNDVPIIPPVLPEEPVLAKEGPEDTLEDTAELPVPEDEIAEESQEDATVVVAPVILEEEIPAPAAAEPATEVILEEAASEVPAEEDEDIAIIPVVLDETVPTEETSQELDDAVLTDEVTAILAQADELIAHPLPEPVVAPEPVEIPDPDPIVPEAEPVTQENSEPEAAEEEAESDEEAPAQEEESDTPAAVAVEVMAEEDETLEEDIEDLEAPAKPQKKQGGLIGLLVAILILLLLGCGAFFYYENYYLQPILGISLNASENDLTVMLDTEIDNDLLTVYCTDTYGNKLPQPVVNNAATFQDLKPGSSYKITVEISGFHKLIGTTTSSHTTPSQTNIVSFTAKTGDQDGSVILHFDAQGSENTTWKVRYSAADVPAQAADCTGNTATITGLEVGKVYTFTLEPTAKLYVVGNTTLEHTASKVIKAQNLAIQGYQNGSLVVSWGIPEGSTVSSWTVRCYNNNGFNKYYTVTEPYIAIEELDPAQGYTVYVEAAGMSTGEDVTITGNSITFKELLLDDSVPGQLTITWNYEVTAPTDGWKLLYTINGGESHIVHCDQNTCTISPLLPGGHYSISFDLPGETTVFGGKKEYDVPAATSFDAFGATAADFTFRMCNTPEDVNWHWYSLRESAFTTKFAVGAKASFVMLMDGKPQKTEGDITTLFVIRDSAGNIVSITTGRARTWPYMWTDYQKQYATELDMPTMPQTAGEYTVDIYFNNQHVTTQAFTIQ